MDLRTLIEAAARGLTGLGENSPDAGLIWEETRGWVTRFLSSATARWLPFYAKGTPCGVHVMRSGVPFPCPGTAVLPCGACGSPACLAHAQVDQFGDGTCYHCIAETIGRKRAERMSRPGAGGPGMPPPVDMSKEVIKRALAALGLKPGASWDEVQKAHREKAAACHPDRAKTESARKRHEEKSKVVNGAMADLKRLYRPEAAA